jgi:hypothetical protein
MTQHGDLETHWFSGAQDAADAAFRSVSIHPPTTSDGVIRGVMANGLNSGARLKARGETPTQLPVPKRAKLRMLRASSGWGL